MESFNTKYYPWYRSMVSMMAWLPVFFLYFNEHLNIRDVILLESIYYTAVVVLEVPSGVFSDRFGRKRTLLISSFFFAVSYAVFGFASPGFINFTVGQLALALGMSFMSGSDTSFYFESLQEIQKEDEFPDREAKVQSINQYTGSAAVLIGGFVAALQLNFAYIASLIFIIPAFIFTILFTEPKGDNVIHEEAREKGVFGVVKYLKQAELRWMFIYTIIIYILSHITYEFYQPYLNLLDLEALSLNTAISSGIIFAIARIFGAYTAGESAKWTRKLGLRTMCAMALTLQILIIGILGLALKKLFIIFILMRSFSMALTIAPINAEIAPRIHKKHRASYFSMQSLGSRLFYSFTLLLLSLTITSEGVNDWQNLSNILIYSCIGGIIFSVALFFLKSGQLFKQHQTE